MGLGLDQSAKFWPIYGQYDAELTRLNNLRAGNIQDYASNYYQMTDPKANELAQNSLNYRRQRSDILAEILCAHEGVVGRRRSHAVPSN